MLKLLRSALLSLAVLLLVVVASGHALAANYGSDSYGACTYGSGCTKHTVITTPSGLEIAVNIVDGQQISETGYDIIITPLNGSGTSFAQADIYINGQKVATVTPDETGTATWHWDPVLYPGTVVKVVATDQDGQTVSKQFTVVVTAHSQQPGNNSNGGGPTTPKHEKSAGVFQPLYTLAASFVKGAKDIIKKLPEPVVIAFPYLLFAVILVEIILLIFQTKRELRELGTLRTLLAQEKEVSDLKQGFLQLVSHYLRTPLTILRSGAEGLPRDGVAPAIVSGIQQTADRLGKTIEDIIASIGGNASTGPAVVSSAAPTLGQHQARQKIIVWLPVVLVGLFVAVFVYLANSVTKYDAGIIRIITQVIIYIVLASVLYQVWRRLHLHRRDKQDAQAVLAEAADVQATRDRVIHETVEKLQGYITSLDNSVKQVPSSATNAQFVTKGLAQLKTVENEFLIANRLQGARSKDPYQTASLKSMFDAALQGVATAAQAKKVSVTLTGDAQITTQSASLATLVLQTLLDNAVAYSAEGGQIEVSTEASHGSTHVIVSDHGQGIPANKVDSLFQPFSKAEGAEVFTHEGMGFSLYLDKLIMTYLGGEIQIQSEQGKGTQVGLSFVAAAPTQGAA